MLRTVGKRNRTRVLAVPFDLLIEKDKKESLVLLDRPANAAGELVAIEPGRCTGRPHSIDDLFVVGPGIGVELGVSNGPNAAAVNLVRTGFGQDLNLAIAAAHFHVNRRENHLEFTDHVGMQTGDRADAIGIAAVLNAQPIADGIDHAGADTGKGRILGEIRATHARHCLHQIENVVGHQRKVSDVLLGEDISDCRR